jgi:hypothetical protein
MNVYAIQTEGGSRPVKIGISRDPSSRLRGLSGAQPFGIAIVHTSEVKDGLARTIERAAHAILKEKRLSGEWFDVTPEEAVSAIGEAIAAIESGESIKEMLRRLAFARRAEKMPDDAVRRLVGKIGKKLSWRDVEEITTFSTATIRRHYL